MTQGYRPPRDLQERFWEKVDKSGECWIWTAYVGQSGYGAIGIGSRTDGSRCIRPAHHIAYELSIGEIPEGKHVHHRCENRACVRPEHLEPLTPREHVLRHDGPTALNARKTHCSKCGLALAGENLLIDGGTGGRRCRVCRRAYTNALKRRRRAAKKGAA